MKEWVITLPEEQARDLWISLSLADQVEQLSTVPSGAVVFLVDRIGSLRIEIFSNEHPPPHFRVACDRGSNAFRISDCTPLHGDALRRHFPQIREWHASHKQDLIDAWNESRPTDCPVGPYRDE